MSYDPRPARDSKVVDSKLLVYCCKDISRVVSCCGFATSSALSAHDKKYIKSHLVGMRDNPDHGKVDGSKYLSEELPEAWRLIHRSF